MKTIPLNSLVVLAGVSIDAAREMFNASEIIEASDAIKEFLPRAKSLDSAAYLEYISNRVIFKLKYGERVVAHMPQVSYEDRSSLVEKVRKMGFHVIFLHSGDNKDYPRDTSAELIDVEKPLKVINFIEDKGFFNSLRSAGFKGVKVVPDIHGDMRVLRTVIRDARRDGQFLVFLGDLLDYGPHPLEVVEEVYYLMVNGEAEVIMGNHERKIYRYLNQVKVNGESKVKLSTGNLVTLSLLAELPSNDTTIWVNRFHAFVNMMRHHRNGDNFVFSHAGATADFVKTNSFRLSGEMETIALFGEVARDASVTSSMVRAYGWMETLPMGTISVVGHDNRGGDEPLVVTTNGGATVYFLDTGCGKGGHLSTLDIKFENDTSKVETINGY